MSNRGESVHSEPSSSEQAASRVEPAAPSSDTPFECAKCAAHNPPSHVVCVSCGAKLLRGRTVGERIGFLIAGIVGAGLLGALAYYLNLITIEGVDIPECCASPVTVLLAAVACLLGGLALAFGPTPKYEQYVKRAARHQDISPQQALADLTTALELAPKKQKADILKRRSDLYVKLGRYGEGVADLAAYSASSEAHPGAGMVSEVSGLPLDSFAEGMTKQQISSLQQRLAHEGALVGLGYCRHCKEVVTALERARCSTCGSKVKDVRYVKPQECETEAAKIHEQHSRRRRRLIGLAVVAALLVTAALICNFAGVFSPRDKPSPSPTAVPAGLGTASLPAGEATFDEAMFSFEYPSDWRLITEADIPALLRGTLRGLTSDQYRYIGGVYTGSLDDCDGCAQIVLVVLKDANIPGTFTDEQYEAVRDATEQRMGSRLLSHRFATVGGLPGAESIHIGASERTQLWDLVVVPPEPGIAYSMSCSAVKEEYDLFEAVFARAYETLRFGGVEEPAEPTPEVTAAAPAEEIAQPTPNVADCRLGAVFQADVSVRDGTQFATGESFTKTWRVRNAGSCPWGDAYRLAFVDGAQMGGPDWVPVPDTEAGSDAVISVELVAPAEAGLHRGAWRICVTGGECFGDRLTVVIEASE